jgi:hypothetical protein
MIFKTKVDLFYKLVVAFVIVLFSFVLYSINFEEDVFVFYFTLILQILILFFLIVSALTTKFTLLSTELICETFYWKKRIQLDAIQKVEKQTNLFAGWKISTAHKGIIITYNKYDELLISPENDEKFLFEVTNRINKSI